MKIAICPGHYPSKSGATNDKHNLSENFIARLLCPIIKASLEQANYDVEIIEGTLKQKVARINENAFDFAFDIHFNADAETDDSDDSVGTGCMVMYYPTSSKRKSQAKIMSVAISAELSTKNHGARPAWYWGGTNPGTVPDYFTRKCNCAAFIPEAGYIDNNGFVEKFMLDSSGLKKLATSISKGILSITSR